MLIVTGLVLSLVELILAVPVMTVFLQIFMALQRHPVSEPLEGLRPRVAVVVPAHNEQLVIDKTLASISRQLSTGDRMVVVADNCSDRTARRGPGAGSRSHDPVRPSVAGQRLCPRAWAEFFGTDAHTGCGGFHRCRLSARGWLYRSSGAFMRSIKAPDTGRISHEPAVAAPMGGIHGFVRLESEGLRASLWIVPVKSPMPIGGKRHGIYMGGSSVSKSCKQSLGGRL